MTGIEKESGITQYEYDALIWLPNVIDYINSVMKYAYDNHDNLISLTNAEKNVIKYEYDHNNRLVKRIMPMDGETSYVYKDNIPPEKSDHGNHDYGYDILYRPFFISSLDQDDEPLPYDAAGNRLTSSDRADNW